ncbi:MAG: tyrosine-type recombinase/integrase [Christensenella sp.]
MALTIKQRGKKYSLIYYYKDEYGTSQQQYEAYDSKTEAEQRIKFIEFLKYNDDDQTLLKLAKEYSESKQGNNIVKVPKNENLSKSFTEFIWTWAPKHARKVRMKPNTYAALTRNIRNHLEPYFGDKIVSDITSEDIDDFLYQMSLKKCMGAKSYNKRIEDIPTLKGSTVMKLFNIISPAFRDAETWGYTMKNPVNQSQAPSYKYVKRNFWTKKQLQNALENIDEPLLHLAVHLAFICSLRPGETAGIDVGSINLQNKSLWVKQTLQRVEEEAMEVVSQEDIIRIFPKKKANAKTVLILKTPKTDKSERKGFLNDPLCEELSERIKQIARDKKYYGRDYNDYGLLFCRQNGDPIEPRRIDRLFKKWQKEHGMSEDALVDMQGIRKSATMYKLRLTNYDLQVVGGDGGQTSPTTILNHYDEVMEEDRRRLSALVENDFYGLQSDTDLDTGQFNMQKMFDELTKAPELAAKLYAFLPALQQST